VPRTELPAIWWPKPAVLEVTYEDVRQTFLTRLHDEEARLKLLGAALNSAKLFPAAAFAELEIFAHRLRGAAAVFGLPEIRDAAQALELAAAGAANERTSSGEPLVQETIQLLAARLNRLNELTRPSIAPSDTATCQLNLPMSGNDVAMA
jgi:HPt (histidine-containing phosphotransfer) domain-containing protein